MNNDPYKRIFAVPSILLNEENFKFEYHELVFISAIQKKKWSNIPYLRTLFSNYPSLLSMWQMRNNLNDKIRSQIFEASNQNTAYIDLSDKQIQELANQSDLACLIDITEHVIRLTDDLIVEFHNFLNEFPEVAKKKINLKLIKNYGIILKYDSSDNKNIELILKESPLPDYEKLSFILGRSESELMARYSPLFRK
ncbi:hypothetical protein HLH13_02365 [Acinetobacter sp. ANC 4279]|uniref:Uncharacterized protein n=1 Tax=Acinetobacter terrae TaxID=2731247 RepID=A0ABX1V1S5_9GAMM|nr:hypothetical protein [Acinetobacter terrae]